MLRVDDDRIIEGMICPWNQPTLVSKPIAGWESFKRGAFDRSLRTNPRLPLLLRHSEAAPAAVMIAHDNRPDGQWVTFRALHTAAGDDALELIREGVYLGLSVGGRHVAGAVTTRIVGGRRMIERAALDLDHVALVRKPAFAAAQVKRSGWDPVAVARARQRLRARRIAAHTTHLAAIAS